MGREIDHSRYGAREIEAFAARLEQETALLGRMAEQAVFDDTRHVAGFELEAWIVDPGFFPLPINDALLEELGNPLVVPELSRFNVELNGEPQPLAGRGLLRMEDEFTDTWRDCLRAAHDLDSTLVMIGILPTLRGADLCLDNMSARNRYRALNAQVLALRGGRPVHLSICGREQIDLRQGDVMLEAAATSFQVHLQCPASRYARYYNASLLLSAATVAVAANSPYLFNTSLWDETRIPLFEQAVDTGVARGPETRRVSFGGGYLSGGPLALFRENVAHYPVLLPELYEEPPERLRHLRLHNGTIWRWNRPLVGFDADGLPHLRVEHRPMAAGPSVLDMMSNAALYYGAAYALAAREPAPESLLPFETARDNFYNAARDGLAAQVVWLDGRARPMRELLRDEILPMADDGLARLGVDAEARDRYLDTVAARVRTGQNGAAWQRAHVGKYGRDFMRLTADYLDRQRSERPVHEWDV
jgi:hypothetical protein